jgi:hypothetical protein
MNTRTGHNQHNLHEIVVVQRDVAVQHGCVSPNRGVTGQEKIST